MSIPVSEELFVEICPIAGGPGLPGASAMPVPIGPIRIHKLDARELTRRLVSGALDQGENGGETVHVVTANAQFYNLAERDGAFRRCLARAEYVCADGISVVLACKWLRKEVVSRVPGVDLVDLLCGAAARLGLPVYFLGGKEGSAEAAAAKLAAKYPGFRAAGIGCPPLRFERDPALLAAALADIRRVRPAIVFVALGAPRQELFIDRYLRPLRVPVAVGVGGSFEMIAGLVRRAPGWVQRSGMEWAFRWVQEPRRLAKRYFVGNLEFLYYVLLYTLKGVEPMETGK